MFGSWVVESVIRYSTNGPVVMARLAASTQAANARLQQQLGLISKNDAAMLAYKRRVEQIAVAQNAFVTKIAAGAAIIGGSAIAYGINQAAKLERAMTGVQIATGATADEYKRLRAMALDVSGVTAQSAVTIAQEMAEAARVAFHDPRQLRSVFPMMAKYADVRYMAHGEDPVRSIEQMTQFAHFFSAYTPEKMRPLLDLTAKLQMTTRAELSQLVTQGKYFIPIASKMGVPMQTIFDYLAIMGQLGFLSGRGGTSMKNIVMGAMAVTPTAHLSKAKAAALLDLQLVGKDRTFRYLTKDGSLDLVGMVQHLFGMRDQFMRQNPRTGKGRFVTDMSAIWGQSAAPLLAALIDAATKQQMTRNQAAFKKIPGVEGQWGKYLHDFFYQWNTFTTNLQNIATASFIDSLPKYTAFLVEVNHSLQTMVAFIGSHPGAGARIGEIVGGLTALFAARAGLGILVALFGAAKKFSLLGGVGMAAAEVGTMTKALRAIDVVLTGGLATRLVALNGAVTLLGASPALAAASALGILAAAIVTFNAKVAADKFADSQVQKKIKQATGKDVKVKGWYTDPTTGMSFPLYETTGGKTAQPPARHPAAKKTDQHAAAGGHHVTIGKLELRIDGSKSPAHTAQAVLAALDPMHLLARSGRYVTDPRIPGPLTVQPA